MCVGEYTNYPDELMLFNSLFRFYAYICVKNQYLKGSADSAKESVSLSLLQYEGGLIDFQRVLDAQRVLSAQANRWSEASGRVSTNLVALYKALGGGWQIRIGKEIIDADTKEEMSNRTDWGKLLESEETALPEPPEKKDNRSKWRSPDW